MEPVFEQMTTAERILYVQALWDRIAADAEEEPITPGQAAELDRRLADYRANPEASIPWETAREQMRRRD
jgi:putative addiction module component (TIGR02574 family)